MATFLIGLVVLFVGAAIYGKFCEKVFGPDDRETPAYSKQDGVDYVPMRGWIFTNCYIEGTTDFIFGPSTALFEYCELHSKRDSYITAASTPQSEKFGYVFKNCKLTAAPGVKKVYLGRPWRP